MTRSHFGRLHVRVCGVLSMLCVIAAAQAEVYRWVDPQGNVIFSDTPHEGAKQIELKPTTIIPSRAPAAPPDTGAGAPKQGAGYESVTVVAPANDSTLRGQQDVAIDVDVAPALQTDAGHTVQLYVDGSAFGSPTTSPHFSLPAVDRGTHQLAAAVLDQNGQELLRSATTVFHLQKNSIADPLPIRPPSKK